jgi:hypothetical protein
MLKFVVYPSTLESSLTSGSTHSSTTSPNVSPNSIQYADTKIQWRNGRHMSDYTFRHSCCPLKYFQSERKPSRPLTTYFDAPIVYSIKGKHKQIFAEKKRRDSSLPPRLARRKVLFRYGP